MGCAATVEKRPDDPPPAALEPDLQRLYEETSLSYCSSGCETTEPGSFTRNFQLARKNFSAKVFHGINEDANQYQKEVDATIVRQEPATAAQIQAWIASVGHPPSALEVTETLPVPTSFTSGSKYLDTPSEDPSTVPTRTRLSFHSDTLSGGGDCSATVVTPQHLMQFSSLPGTVSGPSVYLNTTMNKSVISGTASDNSIVQPSHETQR